MVADSPPDWQEWIRTPPLSKEAGEDHAALGILDAALEQFQLAGLRRSSMEDIARRADVGRVTLYRRFGNKENLVNAVLLREVQTLLSTARASIDAAETIEQRIAVGLVTVMRQIRQHPLLTRLLAIEPEYVLPHLSTRAEPVMRVGIHFIADLIREAQLANLIARYDPAPLAEALARLAHSVLLTPMGDGSFATDERAAEFARMVVIPLIVHGPTNPA